MSLKVSNRSNGHPAPDSNKPVEIAVIGGGIAGLILAIGLQKYSYINVSVYESAHRFGEVGAGVVRGPNAQRAMQLIDPEILEGYNRRAGFDDGVQDEHGLFPWTTVYKGQEPDLDGFVIQFKHKTRGSTVHRAHFVDELVKLLEHGRAHLGKRLDHGYETDAPEAPITLHFTDGSTASADIVVGADGVHSVVRKHVLPHDPTNSAFFTGTCQYCATIPMEKAEASLGKLDQKVAQLVGENGTLFGIPLSNRTIYYIAVTVFGQKAPWNKDKWVADANIDDVKGYFADWDEHARKTVELLPTDGSTMAWSVWEMPPASTYRRGRRPDPRETPRQIPRPRPAMQVHADSHPGRTTHPACLRHGAPFPQSESRDYQPRDWSDAYLSRAGDRKYCRSASQCAEGPTGLDLGFRSGEVGEGCFSAV